jgi:hypothetical protein
MHRQRPLPLNDEEELAALWERLPSRSRRQLIVLTGQLMARAARAASPPSNQEESSNDQPSR